MTKLRGFIPTTALMFTLLFGATFANAGIIVNGRTDGAQSEPDPCTETDLEGIIVNGFTAVATFVRTGIIVNGVTGNETCGIIVNG